jgi:hypothetical protein
MGLLATLRGDAGNYQIKGAIWELGASSYRAYVHLVPAAPDRNLPGSVVSVDGPSVQEVLDAATARVKTTAGTQVQNLKVRTTGPASKADRGGARG